MVYDSLGYLEQIKTAIVRYGKTKWTSDEYLSRFPRGGRIKPIMNLVIYTGERAWDGPTCLHDMLELDEDLKQFVPDYPLYLIDLGHDKEYNFRNGKLRELSELLNTIYSEEAVDREVSRSTLAMAGILANDKKLYEAANNDAEEGGTVNMCTILAERDRKSEMRGERRGIKIGEERGEVNGQNKLVDAIQKLRNGVSRDMIIASGIDAHTVDLAMTVV
jgi:hypothetical protein